MRLKLFRAPSMAEAMRLVRGELGPDALILSSRRVADGMEVTVGMERGDEQPRPEPPPGPTTASHECALEYHGASPTLRRKLGAGSLPFALATVLRFAALPVAVDSPPLLLVGPPGAGKTLSTVRLATRLVMAGTRPMVITADGQRAGATEQLAAFTRVLGLNLLVASQPAALRRALARRESGAPVLIDAPGADLFDPGQCRVVTELAQATGARLVLVLPAGMDRAEAAETAAAHVVLGADLLIATKLDVARRIGSILAAAEAGLALSEAGIGPGAADGMVPLTPGLLSQRLMKLAATAALPAPEPVA